jgi:NhaP-type Na+/H+ or K+/H+ antiporter
MTLIPWYLATGVILVAIAILSSFLHRLPLSTAIVCLGFGVLSGPGGVNLIRLDLFSDVGILEPLTEVAVIISLFTAGLQLRLPLRREEWRLALRLATVGMVLTVAVVTLVGVQGLGLPLGAAIILGAVLAPTDPVLASDIQVRDSTDSDRLRFVLTGEAGLNDGTAFPFVMLGLALLGLHDIGAVGWRWWAVDLLWASSVGIAVGALFGTIVARFVLYLRQRHQEAVGVDNFLAVGLISISYGVALWCHAYGFLAVFAAGVALRRVERRSSSAPPSDTVRQAAGSSHARHLATDRDAAPAYMAEAVLNFNAQLERFAEVTLVVIVGAMLTTDMFALGILAWAIVLLLVVRPLAVYLTLVTSKVSGLERAYVAWFGIRGIGSIYYLSYAIAHGLTDESAREIVQLTLVTIALSVVVHGASATPLMNYYSRIADTDRSSSAA